MHKVIASIATCECIEGNATASMGVSGHGHARMLAGSASGAAGAGRSFIFKASPSDTGADPSFAHPQIVGRLESRTYDGAAKTAAGQG